MPAGQQIEDRLDSIMDEMRRRTGQWIAKSRLPAPNDMPMLGAILTGIAGGVLDELWQLRPGDADQLRAAWLNYVDSYLVAQTDDAAADTQDGAPT